MWTSIPWSGSAASWITFIWPETVKQGARARRCAAGASRSTAQRARDSETAQTAGRWSVNRDTHTHIHTPGRDTHTGTRTGENNRRHLNPGLWTNDTGSLFFTPQHRRSTGEARSRCPPWRGAGRRRGGNWPTSSTTGTPTGSTCSRSAGPQR